MHALSVAVLVLVGASAAGARQSSSALDYRIGPDDVLGVTLFGQDPKYSGDVTVRPDGRITLLLLDDVIAAGLTPRELKTQLIKAYGKYFDGLGDADLHVSPKQINSRKVYITGQVRKPGAYNINDSMSILQLIALAGDLQDYADKKNILLIRKEKRTDGKLDRIFFNYEEVFNKGRDASIPQLQPGDQVIVR
jgi:polysaccharide biosynthesis/export protein